MLSALGYSQDRFSVKAGTTLYHAKTNFFHAKPGLGYQLGIQADIEILNRLWAICGLELSLNHMHLYGRKEYTAPAEKIKYRLEHINLPVGINYNVFNINDTWFFDVHAGASVNFLHNLKLVDDAYEDYYIDPLYRQKDDFAIDDFNGTISLNTFAFSGFNVEYNQFALQFRYNYGLSNPYKKLPIYSVYDLSGRDSFFELSFVYYLDERD